VANRYSGTEAALANVTALHALFALGVGQQIKIVHHQASHDSMIFIFSLSLLDIYPPH
jgi:hypothetical protein